MHSSFNPPPPPPPPPRPSKPTQPHEPCLCAVCKFHHQKCPEGCIFKPHSPLNRKQEFEIMKSNFGFSCISKIAERVPINRHGEFFESLIREAMLRNADPLTGCIGLLDRLEKENQQLRREMEVLKEAMETSRIISNANGNCQKFHGNGGVHGMGSTALSNGNDQGMPLNAGGLVPLMGLYNRGCATGRVLRNGVLGMGGGMSNHKDVGFALNGRGLDSCSALLDRVKGTGRIVHDTLQESDGLQKMSGKLTYGNDAELPMNRGGLGSRFEIHNGRHETRRMIRNRVQENGGLYGMSRQQSDGNDARLPLSRAGSDSSFMLQAIERIEHDGLNESGGSSRNNGGLVVLNGEHGKHNKRVLLNGEHGKHAKRSCIASRD